MSSNEYNEGGRERSRPTMFACSTKSGGQKKAWKAEVDIDADDLWRQSCSLSLSSIIHIPERWKLPVLLLLLPSLRLISKDQHEAHSGIPSDKLSSRLAAKSKQNKAMWGYNRVWHPSPQTTTFAPAYSGQA